MKKKVAKASAKVRALYKAACAARLHSHSPYSGAKVGAAIRTKKGKIYAGCNVENASFGGTVCAERGAIQTAVAAEGTIEIAELLVVTDATPPWPPCGICRQVISEFGKPSLPVHMTNVEGDIESGTFADILPGAFTPAHLEK